MSMTISNFATIFTIGTVVAAAFSFGAVPQTTKVARIAGGILGTLAVLAHMAD